MDNSKLKLDQIACLFPQGNGPFARVDNRFVSNNLAKDNRQKYGGVWQFLEWFVEWHSTKGLEWSHAQVQYRFSLLVISIILLGGQSQGSKNELD